MQRRDRVIIVQQFPSRASASAVAVWRGATTAARHSVPG